MMLRMISNGMHTMSCVGALANSIRAKIQCVQSAPVADDVVKQLHVCIDVTYTLLYTL
jgi:hypothetical protein